MATRGRKPQGPFSGKRESFSARVRPDTKLMLERAAKANGRTLSQEVELRLRRSTEEDLSVQNYFGSWDVAGLVKIIASVLQDVGEKSSASAARVAHGRWLDDVAAYDEAARATMRVLGALRPGGSDRFADQRSAKTFRDGAAEAAASAIEELETVFAQATEARLSGIANAPDVPGTGRKDFFSDSITRQQLQGTSLLTRIDKRGKRE